MELTFAQFVQGFTLPVVICLLAGIGLLIIEMFTPGFGVAGFLGIVALIAAIVLRADSFAAALWTLILVLVIIGVILLVFLRSAAKGAISRSPLILKDQIQEEVGFMSTQDMEYFVGREGITETALRPAGKANFDGVKLDVVSEGEFIPNNVPVKVLRVEGRRILVKAVAKDNNAPINGVSL
ncbi:MAG: NfeD family protein [Christensenellales bacterium]|jgi:membrane-bound ClpP family serine protease